MTASRVPSSARAADYVLTLQRHGLEAASGDAGAGTDVVFVRGPHAAALCAAYEVALALGFRDWRHGPLGRLLGRFRAASRAPAETRIAVPGGRTAAALFDALCAPPFAARVDWARLQLYFVDERAVPPADPESNYRLAREHLIERVRLSDTQVHRMRGEAGDLEAAAREYAQLLEPPLDLVVLGLGEDGHVASLFPGAPLLEERARRVAVVEDSPKPPPRRLTLTPRAIEEARTVLVVAEGAEKRDAALRALEGATTAREVPARMVRDARWIIGG